MNRAQHDGRIALASDIATPPQSTEAALAALRVLDVGDFRVGTAQAFIDSIAGTTTANCRVGRPKGHQRAQAAELIDALLTYQNVDRGF